MQGNNPFWQEAAARNAQSNYQGGSADYWRNLGVNLAYQVYRQCLQHPRKRDYIAVCARNSVDEVCQGDTAVKEQIARGFTDRMKQYGVNCNG